MLALGHPILGDPLYATGAARDHPRLMLHSEELRLRHPDGGAGVKFRAKGPVLSPQAPGVQPETALTSRKSSMPHLPPSRP